VEPLFEALKTRLSESPGRAMAVAATQLREASVLVPLFLREGVPHVLFTKRPETLRTHAGQVSFPGGGREAQDPTPLHTALREFEEELGVAASHVSVLGMLDETPTTTSYRITPFVGAIPHDLAFRPSALEVQELLQVPIPLLVDPARQRVERWMVGGVERDIFLYEYGPHIIWGATARIVQHLLQCAGDLLER
jgi:8-oxo-dGTP pyrophosphatase MutT (NUDIX family)